MRTVLASRHRSAHLGCSAARMLSPTHTLPRMQGVGNLVQDEAVTPGRRGGLEPLRSSRASRAQDDLQLRSPELHLGVIEPAVLRRAASVGGPMRSAAPVILLLLVTACASGPRAWVIERFPGGAVIGTNRSRLTTAPAREELDRLFEQRVFEVCRTNRYHELGSGMGARGVEVRIGCGTRAVDTSASMPPPEGAAVRQPLRRGGGGAAAPLVLGKCTAQQVDEMNRGGLSASAIERACSP